MAEQKKPSADSKMFGFTVISAGNAVSAIMAYFRFAQISAIFGATWKTDALAIAMVFPQLLRDVVGHSFGAAFIPIYSRVIEERGVEDGVRFVNRVICWLLIVGVMFMAVLWFLSAILVRTVSPGGSPEMLELAGTLLRLVLPIIALGPLRGVLANFIKYEKRFRVLPLSGVINLGVSLALILIVRDAISVKVLPLSMIVGSLAELLYLFHHSRISGFRLSPDISPDPHIGQLARMSVPVVFGTTVGFLAPIADKMLASFLPVSSVTAIDYANRIKTIVRSLTFGPLVLFADLDFSAEAAKGKLDLLLGALRRSMNVCSLVMFPTSALLCVLAVPVVSVFFQRGNFTPENSIYVGYALAFYAPWLAQFGLGSLVSRAFYAQKDSFTPVMIGVFGIVTNVLLNVILVGPLGIGGLALATTLTSTAKTVYLTWSLSRKMHGLGLKRIRSEQLKMLTADLLAVGLLLLLLYRVPFDPAGEFLPRLLRLALYASAGLGMYTGALLLFRCETLTGLLERFRTKIRGRLR